MISLQKHKQIHNIIADWEALAKLYETIQTDKNLTVQVNGNYREEFREGAIKEAKILLKDKAQKITADLKQLGFDTSTLAPLREVITPPPKGGPADV